MFISLHLWKQKHLAGRGRGEDRSLCAYLHGRQGAGSGSPEGSSGGEDHGGREVDTMAQCYFCGRKFDSRQGVRAHLKTCVAYQNRGFESRPGPDVRKAEPTGRAAPQASVPKAKSFHYPSQVPRQITAEKERTKSSDFPLDESPPEEALETHEENQNVLLRSALERAKGAERRERVKRARIETGKRYAEGILKGIRFLNHWELYTANNEVEKALKCELTGEESPGDAERIAEG